MSEITRTRTGEFMRTLLGILIENPDGLTASDAIDRVRKKLDLSAYELANLPSGRPRFEKVLHFGTTNMARAGWLAKPKRSKWVATDAGKHAYSSFTEPYRFREECERAWQSLQFTGTQPIPTAV